MLALEAIKIEQVIEFLSSKFLIKAFRLLDELADAEIFLGKWEESVCWKMSWLALITFDKDGL